MNAPGRELSEYGQSIAIGGILQEILYEGDGDNNYSLFHTFEKDNHNTVQYYVDMWISRWQGENLHLVICDQCFLN